MAHEKLGHFRDRGTFERQAAVGGNEGMLAFAAAVIFSPAPGTLSGRTIRSPSASRAILARCVKKTTPEPPRSVLSSRRPARSSLRPWVPRCLRALAAAAVALALALCPPDIIPAHASSIGERLKLSTPYPCEDVRSYYGGLEGLSGDVLMAKLGAVVSPHASLRYKDVGLPLAICFRT